MTSVPLRRKLFFLVAVGIAPLVIMSAVSLIAFAVQQRAEGERIALEITRALSIAVDFELHRSISVLESLATSPSLDDDLDTFRERAVRTLAVHPSWTALVVADPSGRVEIDTRVRPDLAVPADVGGGVFARVARLGKPVVDELRKDSAGEFHVRIGVPVRRDGKVRAVLAALVKPGSFVALLERQLLPSDWVVSVFDARGLRVARSRRHLEYIGTPASPSLGELMRREGSTGTGVVHALEGDRIYAAYVRLRRSGWSVAVGIPPSVVEAGERRSLVLLAGGILVSMALAVFASLRVARRIAEPMGELRDAARALGTRRPIATPETSIDEVRQVGEALQLAAEERARGESERERLLALERQARAAAEATNRAKDEFLAMLGHELRNPIGAIANAAQVLERTETEDATVRRAREIIGRQIGHLSRMMEDLLDAGRAVLGKIVLDRQPIDLATAAARALTSLHAAGQLDRHRLVENLEPVWIHADPTRVEQIVSNLLTNAVRYSPTGEEVRVSVRQEAGDAVLRVADDGIGMTFELAERAFDLFVQGEQPLDRSHGGLGIGLTLVRRLAELQGGSARAESAGPGRGSELIVRFPRIEAPRPPPPRTAGIEHGPSIDVLVVEDNEDARVTLRDLLELGGHRVRVAEDGLAGVTAALAFRPRVVLLDVGLPKLDGYEVARRIRAADDGGWSPLLIAITGYGRPDDRDRSRAAGFDAHLVKPVQESDLRELFARAGAGDAAGPAAS